MNWTNYQKIDFSTRRPETVEMFNHEEAMRYIQGCDYPESADDLLFAWQLQECFRDLANMHILDVMCGPGRLGRELLSLGAGAMTFHDGYPIMVDHAIKEASGIVTPTQKIDRVLSPVEEMPVLDGAFDLVVSHNSTHQLGSFLRLTEAMREMLRVTKPGGFIYIADYQRGTTPEFVACLERRLRETRPDIVDLLVPTFLAAFTKEEFGSVISKMTDVKFWQIIDGHLPVLTPEMKIRVAQDPVKGHIMDFSPISLQVIVQKEDI